jgi:hypothetical protein
MLFFLLNLRFLTLDLISEPDHFFEGLEVVKVREHVKFF